MCLRFPVYVFIVLYRDSLTFLHFYGNGQWVNHCAPSITIQAVETINALKTKHRLLYKDPGRTTQETLFISVIKANQFMI